MESDYAPVHRLKFKFSSNELIHIRITVGDIVKVIQCRTEMTFVTPLALFNKHHITIENLTDGVACNIDEVWLNYLNITPVMYEFTKTYTKADNQEIGGFVPDIYSPDLCVIEFDHFLYTKLMLDFKLGKLQIGTPGQIRTDISYSSV